MTDPDITQADRDLVASLLDADDELVEQINAGLAFSAECMCAARHRMLGRAKGVAQERAEIVVGSLTLRPPYGGDKKHIAIHRNDGPAAGEGGDFSVAKLEALLLKFYEENF